LRKKKLENITRKNFTCNTDALLPTIHMTTNLCSVTFHRIRMMMMRNSAAPATAQTSMEGSN
jgi:hypothetical protein